MTDIDPVLVERYQMVLQQDPKAKIFAPLAEAYRKMGLIEEGIQICLSGIKYHPEFASGRVALGRLYLDKQDYENAEVQLKKAVDISPENLLAQGLLGETYIKLKKAKEALTAFKMLLFLNPLDEKAQKTVKKLESLTADEYDEDVFAMTKLNLAAETVNHIELEIAEKLSPLEAPANEVRNRRDLERFLSLADAFLVRNDFDRAMQTLENAQKNHGESPEIARRLRILNQRFLDDSDGSTPPSPPAREVQMVREKIALLKELGHRIQTRKRDL